MTKLKGSVRYIGGETLRDATIALKSQADGRGHLVLICGASLECSRCSASASVWTVERGAQRRKAFAAQAGAFEGGCT